MYINIGFIYFIKTKIKCFLIILYEYKLFTILNNKSLIAVTC